MKITILPVLLCLMIVSPVVSAAERVSLGDFLLSRAPATAPSTKASFSMAGEVDFDSAAGGFSYERFELDIPFSAPHYLNDNNAFMIGMDYKATWLDTDTLLGDMDLHDFRLKLRWMYRQPGSKWSWMTLLQPGLATDGNSIDMDDFSVNGQLGFRYAASPDLAWIGGVYFFENSMETRVYPGIGFQWKPNDDLLVRLSGPSFKASWQPSEDWILHAIVASGGGTWNVEEAGADFDVRLRSYHAAVGVERQLSEKLWLGLWAGMTFANELEIDTASGTGVFEDDADSGWFMKLGIRKIVW